MLRFAHVHVRTGGVPRLADVSFEARPGEAWGVIGPAGCGKGTLVAAAAGAVALAEGDVEVAGRSMRRDPAGARGACGYVPSDLGVRPALEAGDFLDVFAAAAGLVGEPLAHARKRALDLAGVRAGERLDRLSGGAMKRLLLGQAVLHDPAVLALDDPFRALDPHERHVCERLIETAILVDRTVIAALDDGVVPSCFTHVALLDRGRLVATGPNHPAAFAPGATWTWRATVPTGAVEARERLADLVPEAHVIDDHTVECRIDPALTPPAALVTALVRAGHGVESAGFHPPWTVQLVPARNLP